jgi:hypothetical protein
MGKKYTKKPNEGNSFVDRYKFFMNRRDKEFLQVTIEQMLPLIIAFISMIGMLLVEEAIWGSPPPLLLGRMAAFVFFLICSVSGVIMVLKRRALGAVRFTVTRGRTAVIVGFIWALLCIICAFFMLWEPLKMLIGN